MAYWLGWCYHDNKTNFAWGLMIFSLCIKINNYEHIFQTYASTVFAFLYR